MVKYILEVLCGIPRAGNNTAAPQISLSFGNTYNYVCLTGYETNDTVVTMCLADGTLSLQDLPMCTSEYLFSTLIEPTFLKLSAP